MGTGGPNLSSSSSSKSESLWNLIKQVISNPYSPYIDCATQHVNQFYEDDLIYKLEDNSTGLLLNPDNEKSNNNLISNPVSTPKTNKKSRKNRNEDSKKE